MVSSLIMSLTVKGELPESVKKHVLHNMSQENGHVRVIACTVLLEWWWTVKTCITSSILALLKTSNTKKLECYVQECGRSTGDGQPSFCLLLQNELLGAHCCNDVKNDISDSTDSRCAYLFSHFQGKCTSSVSGHQCCDMSAKTCGCGEEMCKKPVHWVSMQLKKKFNTLNVFVQLRKRNEELKKELFEYMKNVL